MQKQAICKKKKKKMQGKVLIKIWCRKIHSPPFFPLHTRPHLPYRSYSLSTRTTFATRTTLTTLSLAPVTACPLFPLSGFNLAHTVCYPKAWKRRFLQRARFPHNNPRGVTDFARSLVGTQPVNYRFGGLTIWPPWLVWSPVSFI